jgi:hypothetical protein
MKRPRLILKLLRWIFTDELRLEAALSNAQIKAREKTQYAAWLERRLREEQNERADEYNKLNEKIERLRGSLEFRGRECKKVNLP